ncbi:hypothetical protein [Nocardia sp. NBC_01329]|uniref:hypothetical protein n=1 Tax=Nocardia sp. NBC_01329 TaxID=2903594 RepID=UPI002E0E64BC|nr:hypothetical protein OG405_27600 [Nocardia sp. NBC_01329]
MHRSRRTVSTAASVMGALAAALVVAAPHASAAITEFELAPGSGTGSSPAPYGTHCAYTASATAEPGEYVSFYDSQKGSFDPPGAILVGASGTVTAQWSPETPGTHTLHAVNIGSEQSLQVEVGSGLNLGSACPVL